MGRISEHFTLTLAVDAGGDVARTKEAARPFWASHNAERSRDAALEVGIPPDDIECITDFVIAHQIGTQDAFRLAQLILSDPQTRGREVEALRLLERGCDHAQVRAALRAAPASTASAPAEAGGECSGVVPFRRPDARTAP